MKVLIVSHYALDKDKIAEFNPSEGDKKTKGRSDLAVVSLLLGMSWPIRVFKFFMLLFTFKK